MVEEDFRLKVLHILLYFKGLIAQLVRAHLDKDEVRGSSPRRPTIYGAVAQLGEHLICIQKVVGSIPISSTRFRI